MYDPKVIKRLQKIGPKDKQKVRKKIESLLFNPLAGKSLSGAFSGLRSLRAWPLRMIYIFDPKNNIITIQAIEYCGNAYRD